VKNLPTERAAREALAALDINLNRDLSERPRAPLNVCALADHYIATELVNREQISYSTESIYRSELRLWILPKWGSYSMAELNELLAVEIEKWLGTLPVASSSKSKTKYVFSALCSHAMRWGWLTRNPVQGARQSAKSKRNKIPLTFEELQALMLRLDQMDHLLVLLDVPTGLRVSELLALQWRDVDFESKVLNVEKSIWHQRVGRVKTRLSDSQMPLDDEMIEDLLRWRCVTPYCKDDDWIFASPRLKGRGPYWPDAVMKHIRKVAKDAGITKHLSWHVFRHSFATLLHTNGEDVKTVQRLLRHSTPKLTLDTYIHSVQPRERAAQKKVVEMITPVIPQLSKSIQ
jgi:integrase